MKWLMPDVPRADIAGQLGGFDGAKRQLDWTDGTVSIPRGPRGRAARRAAYDKRYLAAVKERFGGPRFRLKLITVDARGLMMSNAVVNQERYGMYKRMLRAGDKVPPLVVEDISASGAPSLRVIDGNHRTQAALDVKEYKLQAFLREPISLMESLR